MDSGRLRNELSPFSDIFGKKQEITPDSEIGLKRRRVEKGGGYKSHRYKYQPPAPATRKDLK